MIFALSLFLAAVESTCVPINSDMFWVTFPDGKGESFVRTAGDPNLLAGPSPWFGIVRPERGMVNIATKSAYKGTPVEYGYVGGHLRFMSKGGKDSEVDPTRFPRRKGNVRSFWPTKALYAELLKKHDIWKGSGRLRFISRNPNRTALVLAQLSLLAVCLVFFARSGVWRLHGVLLSLIFVLLQFQSLSRGGILAFAVGVCALFYHRLRHRFNRRMLFVVLLGGIVFTGVSFLAFRQRLDNGISSDSPESRTAIWREVPRMMAAAPWGWGLWKSGPAYNSWFEKPDRHHMTGDLFNDHLSRFVEGGFVWGGCYVFAWLMIFFAGWRWARKGHSPAFLVTWLAYFVASSFNPMNYWGRSFWIPGLVSGVWLVRVLRSAEKKSVLSPLLPLGCTAMVLLVAGAVALFAPPQDIPLRVAACGRRVVVGKGEPQVWVADDGFVLNGNFNGYPGREMRQHYRQHPNAESLGLVERLEDLPDEMDRLVLTGTCCEDFLKMDNPPKAKHLVFLTPPFGSDKIPEKLRTECDVHFLTGEFAAVLTGDDLKKESWVHVVPGAGVYVPGWLNVVVKEKSDGA